MKNKAKGSKAERELYEMFIANSYRAVRVAGSGTMENADCDIIAGKKGERYCIEVKSSKKPYKYISKEQINNFMVFAEIFKLTPVIAIRFNRVGWFFINPKKLKDSGKNWVITLKGVRKKGKRFAQFFGKKDTKKDKSLKVGKDIFLDEKELDNTSGAVYLTDND